MNVVVPTKDGNANGTATIRDENASRKKKSYLVSKMKIRV
jgi:hypothetical protein